VDRVRRNPRSIELDDSDSAAPSAEDLVLERVEHGDMAAALRALSPELRAVLRATALDGLTTREASVLLGIPQGTVKSRLLRARRQLKEALA
jgi:RNA polymerase sigma-70 factor (ECF subfamily)